MRLRARLVAVVVAAVAVVGLAGCGSDSSDESGDALRVASIGFGDVDTLLSLGIQPVAVAPWSKNATEVVGEWAKPLLTSTPTLIQDSGSEMSSEAIEKIAAARPDVIVAVNTGYDDATYAKLEEIARVVRRPAGFEAWGVPWREQVKAIAAGVDKASEGDELIAKTEATLKQVAVDRPDLAKHTGVVVLPKSDGALYAYALSDGRGQTMQELGIPPLPRVEELAGKAFYTEVSAENLAILGDVDMMVYLDYDVDVANDAPFRALNVTRENHVVTVGQSLGQAMSMPNPVTLAWVAEKLVPQLPTF
ncbi:ABC transporter substrate-binding protein [Gordonia hydrophobica]|uniref:ABC transporter substrate-binding protein n=1 Tax=Gordonia hydrophobica TaxID=40516 RepID=A0ABZ2U626_9ACTN|nr:ABC transporter substrate-binding protein [Gordonia hydrophobica]MBM7365515.1 iron complex transport system substrate-binding protein [Gordonia hydrophobica]